MSKDLQRRWQNERITQTPGGTLAERIRAAVAQTQGPQGGGEIPRDVALLLDVSGSMNEYIGANIRKITELGKLAQEFQGVRRFTFHSTVEELKPGEVIGPPRGGTSMHLAFSTLKAKGVRHVVMITDGEPDSEERALREARGLKVDVFYVGPDPAPGFLADLAKATGGEYGKASLTAYKALGTRIRALLPAPKGAIEL